MANKNKSNDNSSKGFLAGVERVGNALPHPAMIFVIMIAILAVISALAAKSNVTVNYYDAKAEENVELAAVSLLNADGIRYMINSVVENFTSFAPLGTVLVAMLGVGVAEYAGFFDTGLKKLLSNVPSVLLTAAVVFAGIISNIASDAGYVVVVPLGAMIFASAGKHPIAGLAAAFAGVSGGFSANLIFGPTDALLAGITNEALRASKISATVDVTGNWYFLIVSTFILTIVGTLVTEKIVIPNLGEYKGSYVHDDKPITDLEKKALRNSIIAILIFVVILILAMAPQNAILKEADKSGDINIQHFLGNGLIFAILLLFLIPGVVYGKTVGKINSSNDLVEAMSQAMKSMSGFLVLAFFAAQFVSFFAYTNLGTVLSVKGAEFLEAIGLTGIPLIILFIILSAFINLFIGSASAKWAIMAPIFVPMFFKMGLSPELTQMAYRIADSSTNIISPLMNYFAMIVIFMQKYDKDRGLGTLISTMLPYSMAFLLLWSVLLIIWMAFGIPLGPGAPLTV
ncbi:AbgT family transporter [uncultured Anaerococcus sp.]|uniref:AbgT family transporter n=1 Tax=uncultured Anaerococcus sp. TaxID=293428 RepID=UPI00280C2F12|nr:AbgT family transporter [uncultured Anaerococcus sp.]MDU5148723.1 AbgT family transporter [Anaerococcus prevotii]